MSQKILSLEFTVELEEIYQSLQEEYERLAKILNFSCTGCPDNCCDSYFLHYTYIEWAYLFEGLNELPAEKSKAVHTRAVAYVEACREAKANDEVVQKMCPLNEDGLCVLYKHRLLVCRTHGVPARLLRPDGKNMPFPGCFRAQEIVEKDFQGECGNPVDRTPHLRRLAMLENSFLQNRRHILPKVRKTIAEMILAGPPKVPDCTCRK